MLMHFKNKDTIKQEEKLMVAFIWRVGEPRRVSDVTLRFL